MKKNGYRVSLQLLLAGFGLVALQACAANTEATTLPGSAQGPPTAVEAARCESAVAALLGNELVMVYSGRPDVGAATSELVNQSFVDEPDQLARVQQVEETLLATASADLLSRYQMDVAAEIRAYHDRIAAACAAE